MNTQIEPPRSPCFVRRTRGLLPIMSLSFVPPPQHICPLRSATVSSVRNHVSAFSFRVRASGGNGKIDRQTVSGAIISDETVPEGHRGLHNLLYGEEGSEVHRRDGYRFREGEDDGSAILPVDVYLQSRDNEKPTGVYALYDQKRNIQYIGYARNVVLAVKAHLNRVGEERCTFIKAMIFMNKSMATKQNLEREAQNWLDDAGTVPPGNGVERSLWTGEAVDTSAMSPAEVAEYEEKKLKMRLAMGENLHDEVKGEDQDTKLRRLKMIAAVEGDDWSEVVGGQTAETLGAVGPGRSTPPAQQPVVSPFTRASVHREIGSTDPEHAPLTVDSVDAALNQVRPYLIADGGNVSVAAVEADAGRVFLELQGACGTCPSSTATMKMGIERALKATFGDQLKEVLQVGQQDGGATVETVNQHLNILRPAIQGYGGSVEVVAVEGEVVRLKYVGPAPIASGIRAAIRDKFPMITTVEILSE